MITNDDLARRAKERSEEPGDYWDRSARFLRSIWCMEVLTRSQWNWRSQLRAELTEAWE